MEYHVVEDVKLTRHFSSLEIREDSALAEQRKMAPANRESEEGVVYTRENMAMPGPSVQSMSELALVDSHNLTAVTGHI